MSSILLKHLAKVSGKSNEFTYKDLHLDIMQNQHFIGSNRNAITAKDIEESLDEAAIANSIFNILNTRQGQRFLIPTFGCNLLGYVGLPVTASTGDSIRQTIFNAIKIWEPRVTIDYVEVVGRPDEHEYDISIQITIPSLQRTDINLIAILTNQGILERKVM